MQELGPGADTAAARGPRPERLVVVCGTGTEVGKTWVAAAVLRECRRRGLSVAARKPAQSFDVDADGAASAAPPTPRCSPPRPARTPPRCAAPDRSFHRAMAPPMAAEALGLPPFTVGDLVAELEWPPEPVALGVVELAGGVRSPQAADGDATDLVGPPAARRGGAGGRRRPRHHQRRPALDGRRWPR